MGKRIAVQRAISRITAAVWIVLLLSGCGGVENPLITPTARVFQSVTPRPTFTLQTTELPLPQTGQSATPFAQPGGPITVENARRLQLVQSAGLGRPQTVAFSNSGNDLVIAASTGIYFYDTTSLQQKSALQTSQQQISLAFSADGKLSVSGDWHGRITVWDISGNVIHELDAGRLPVLAVAFSPDGARLAASSWNGEISIWQLDNERLERTLEVRNRPVEALAFSEDGSLLYAWAKGESIQVWNADTGAVRDDIYLGKDPLGYAPQQAIFGSEGRLLAVYYTRNVRVFRTDNGQTQMNLSDVTEPVQSLALSDDGSTLAVMVLAAAGGFEVRTYAVETGILINRITLPVTGEAPLMALSPDGGELVTVNGVLQIWSVVQDEDQTQPVSASSRREFFPGRVLHTRPGATDQIYLVSTAGSIQTMDLTGGEYSPITTFPSSPESGGYTASALLPEEMIAFGDAQGNVSAFAWGSDTALNLQSHTGAVRSLAFSPDGLMLASSADDGQVLVQDLSAGTPAVTLEIGQPASRMVFHTTASEDELFFVQTGQQIQLWRLGDGTMLQQWDAQAMTLSARNDLLAVAYSGGGGAVNVYHVPDGELIQNFPLEAFRLAFSPDGSVLAMAGRDLTLWNTADGELLLRISDYPCCGEIFFPDDGVSLVQVQTDGTVQV